METLIMNDHTMRKYCFLLTDLAKAHAIAVKKFSLADESPPNFIEEFLSMLDNCQNQYVRCYLLFQ